MSNEPQIREIPIDILLFIRTHSLLKLYILELILFYWTSSNPSSPCSARLQPFVSLQTPTFNASPACQSIFFQNSLCLNLFQIFL